ncbi:N-acetylglucosamine-6-phosphate deacetylase [Lyngbya sp. CCY1209]|uniref:N-acetylglucosamine-6-phosphate deacetylase n=1 Tax=Lyngbya sp. CCY1209 TaxID=2886103 RepID=UPI002D20FF1D|nr:N-acetylglucosamine-6-phosphate deacetylase [Lyngbya sp. CCY1209]MEB3882872.1 N-acetylglucosamine-6-phosphate deacetylase [Lyngbya sp. CCY1209]
MIDSTEQLCAPIDFINARVPGYSGLQTIRIRGGRVEAIAPDLDASATATDLGGDRISLGAIDVQINGALGLAFPELTPKDTDVLQAICEYLWKQGIDGFLPTIVTTAPEKFRRSLETLSRFHPDPFTPAADILGAHLEGPFLNPQKRGAHPENYLLPPTADNLQRILGDHAPQVKVITLAPELDGAHSLIPELRNLGMVVSLGHSQATAAEARRAFDLGATMVTHAFNAMPPLHHREPGLLGAALSNPGVYCGTIADGEHVCPAMLDLLLRGARGEVFVVSDALAPLGLPDGVYPWDDREMTVSRGTARLADGTLAGTTVSVLAGAANLAKWGLCDPERAIALATEVPRRAIGLSGAIVGQPATRLLRWTVQGPSLTWRRLSEPPLPGAESGSFSTV